MIYSDSFIKIFFTDVRDHYVLEHSLVSLLRFLFISRLLFLYTFSIWALVLSFNFHAQMRESTHFQVSQESFFQICRTNHVVSSVACPFLHGHPFSHIYALLLVCPVCHVCFVPCLADPSIHALAILTSLCLLFLQNSAMAICISTRLWFPNTGILHLLYLIFLGCKLLYSSEMLLAVLSKNPFLTLQPHEISLFCLLTCFFCSIFCKFLCHNVSFMLLSLLGNVTKHRYLYVHH